MGKWHHYRTFWRSGVRHKWVSMMRHFLGQNRAHTVPGINIFMLWCISLSLQRNIDGIKIFSLQYWKCAFIEVTSILYQFYLLCKALTVPLLMLSPNSALHCCSKWPPTPKPFTFLLQNKRDPKSLITEACSPHLTQGREEGPGCSKQHWDPWALWTSQPQAGELHCQTAPVHLICGCAQAGWAVRAVRALWAGWVGPGATWGQVFLCWGCCSSCSGTAFHEAAESTLREQGSWIPVCTVSQKWNGKMTGRPCQCCRARKLIRADLVNAVHPQNTHWN